MKNIRITLTSLEFPENLEDKYCKFRPLITVRYLDTDAVVKKEMEVMPGLRQEDYWECEGSENDEDNYVRKDNTVDMSLVPEDDRTITISNKDMNKGHELVFSLFDVERDSFWNKLGQEILKIAPELAAGIPVAGLKTIGQILSAFEKATDKPTATKEEIFDKAMGITDKKARRIWTSSTPLSGKAETFALEGTNKLGKFVVGIRVEVF